MYVNWLKQSLKSHARWWDRFPPSQLLGCMTNARERETHLFYKCCPLHVLMMVEIKAKYGKITVTGSLSCVPSLICVTSLSSPNKIRRIFLSLLCWILPFYRRWIIKMFKITQLVNTCPRIQRHSCPAPIFLPSPLPTTLHLIAQGQMKWFK